MVNDDVMDLIPDKRQEKNTTSLKFKRDLIEYLGDNYKDKICLEIGTHKGYSARILSTLFKKIITCETNIDYIHIYDIVEAFLLAAIFDGNESYYVLGCDEKKTISDVWNIISESLGGIPIDYNDKDLNKMETRSYVANYDKFNSLTGWYPRFNIENGIKETIGVLNVTS